MTKGCSMYIFLFISFASISAIVTEPADISESADAKSLNGPSEFYDKKGNFYMTVKDAVVLHLHEKDSNGKTSSTKIKLDKPAQSIIGSTISSNVSRTVFAVSIKWEGHSFEADAASNEAGQITPKVLSLIIKMVFAKHDKKFTLTDLSILQARVDRRIVESSAVQVVGSDGSSISAPIGLTFACDSLGQLKPKKEKATDTILDSEENISFGLTLPKARIRVFDVSSPKLSPLWECQILMPIGLWVGLSVTLLLGVICVWGFSMLASINTMDKFDDSKSKPLHVSSGRD